MQNQWMGCVEQVVHTPDRSLRIVQTDNGRIMVEIVPRSERQLNLQEGHAIVCLLKTKALQTIWQCFASAKGINHDVYPSPYRHRNPFTSSAGRMHPRKCPPPLLTVFAGAGTALAMNAIADAFTAQTGIHIAYNYANAAQLAKQLEAGTPPMFFSPPIANGCNMLSAKGASTSSPVPICLPQIWSLLLLKIIRYRWILPNRTKIRRLTALSSLVIPVFHPPAFMLNRVFGYSDGGTS